METAFHDLRHAIRMLIRMRGAAVVAVITLALGIGATTTIFSVVYAALLRPLPFADPDRLVVLYVTRTTPREGLQKMRWSHAEIAALGSTPASLEDVASFTPARANLTGDGEPEQIFGEIVTPRYLRLLRVSPQTGRTFLPEEDIVPGGHPVAIISAKLWQRRFAADPAIIGRSIGINGVPLTIVGVLPATFSGLSGRADVWMPTTMAPRLTSYLQFSYPDTMVVVKADRDVMAIVPSTRRAVSSVDAGLPIYDVQTLDDRIAASMSRPRFNAAVLGVFAAAALLLAAVGVYGVMAYSVSFRLHELGVRLALGAGAPRVLGLVLGEGAGLGAAIGLAGAIALTRLMRSSLYGVAPIDPLIFAAATAVIMAVALTAAYLPARRAAAVDPVIVLRNQ
jgi:hypothetical protein